MPKFRFLRKEFGTYSLQPVNIKSTVDLQSSKNHALALTDPLKNMVTFTNLGGDISFPAHEQLHIEAGTTLISSHAHWYVKPEITYEDKHLYNRFASVVEAVPPIYEKINISYKEQMDDYRRKVSNLIGCSEDSLRKHGNTPHVSSLFELFVSLRRTHDGTCSDDLILGVAQRVALFFSESPWIKDPKRKLHVLSKTILREKFRWKTLSDVGIFCWKNTRASDGEREGPHWFRIIEVDEIHDKIAAALQNMMSALFLFGRDNRYIVAILYGLSNFLMRHVYPHCWPFWAIEIDPERKLNTNMIKLEHSEHPKEERRRFLLQFEALKSSGDCTIGEAICRGFDDLELPSSPRELLFDSYAELFVIIYDLFSTIRELVIKGETECPYCRWILQLLPIPLQKLIKARPFKPDSFVENSVEVPLLFHEWCREVKTESIPFRSLIKT